MNERSEVVIGVLAVQGSFHEHIVALNRLNDDIYSVESKLNELNKKKNIKLKVVDIRSAKDVIPDMRGLIIPGILIVIICFWAVIIALGYF